MNVVGVTRAASPRRHRVGWRPNPVTWLLALAILGGTAVLLYPSAASWVSSYNQSQLIAGFSSLLDDADPDVAEQLALAREYNAALTAGVELRAGANVPAGAGTLADDRLDYTRILTVNADGLMARVKIPRIDVDLPIYHGTSDDTLLKGAGHLEGSHLPIGGAGTHSVITAHRGLASSAMFTNLDRVRVGDTFTLETFGEVLTYRVTSTVVVEPEDTESLRATPGADLVTLVTCTPLGVNSHRILVVGERVTPTPEEELRAAGAAPDIPGVPWWIAGACAALLLAVAYVWRTGYSDARLRGRDR